MTVAAVVVAFVARAWMWPSENALVGWTEAEVMARYGEPLHEFAGHYGLPDAAWTQRFKRPIKSAIYWRLRGEIYVTFENRNGQWIVVAHLYLPRGVVLC
jgi:hypothetical protein